MPPQLGVGGGMPAPRKLRLASAKMAAPAVSEAWTRIVLMIFGSTWAVAIRAELAPTARALSTYSHWPRLSACERTLVMVDGPGHGSSGPPPATFTLEDCATAAIEVCDALGLETVDWVGNAWGGHVGILIGVRKPRRMRSLVTMAAPLTPLVGVQHMQLSVLVGIYRVIGPAPG